MSRRTSQDPPAGQVRFRPPRRDGDLLEHRGYPEIKVIPCSAIRSKMFSGLNLPTKTLVPPLRNTGNAVRFKAAVWNIGALISATSFVVRSSSIRVVAVPGQVSVGEHCPLR